MTRNFKLIWSSVEIMIIKMCNCVPFFLQPVQINNLEEFVKSLTTEMHERIPNSLVIWYDSVTYKGDLAWQNELNANNR